jgi:hypothetical protein
MAQLTKRQINAFRKKVSKQEQRVGGKARTTSDVAMFLEGSEKDWNKLIPRSKKEDYELALSEETFTDEEARVYLGSMGGVSTKSFCKKTVKMLQILMSVGIRPTFSDEVFWIPVERVSKSDIKKYIGVYGGSNGIPGYEDEAQVYFEDGYFYLFSPAQEAPLYIAEDWSDFKVLARVIPLMFKNKAENGRLKIFDWDDYAKRLTKKYK